MLLTAACGVEGPPLDSAGEAAFTTIPPPTGPTLLERYDLLKLNTEALYPERAHQTLLIPAMLSGSADINYDRDSCELSDTEALRRKSRVSFAELGAIGGALNRTVSGQTCAAADCFLHVNTAQLGRTLTITGDNAVACEDPDTAALGYCGLGMTSISGASGTRPTASYRGNVVVADVIRIDGEVNIGSLSLILVARSRIEFTATGRILGPATVRAASGANGTTTPAYPPVPEPCCVLTRSYTSITPGGGGSGGAPSGSVVLISPEVRTPNDTYDSFFNPYHSFYMRPFVALGGAGGGAGGDAGQAVCRMGDSGCDASVRARAAAGGRGGPGGAGGNLIVIADRLVGSDLDGYAGAALARQAGPGGAGGRGTVLTRYDLSPILPRSELVPLGANGAAGAAGVAGYRHDLPLSGNYFKLAYLVARRGAERRLITGRYYARSSIAADRSRAQSDFADGIDQYCRVFPSPPSLITPPPPRTVPAAPGRPTTYVTTAASAAQTTTCRELDERWERVAYGRNYFGFSDDFVMYLRPDVVKAYRDGLLTTFDTIGRQFTDAVAAQTASESVRVARVLTLSDQLVDNDLSLVEKEKKVEIAQQRYRALAEAALTKLGWYKLNNDELSDLQARSNAAQSAVEDALQLRPEEPCDFWCVLGNVITAAVQIASLIANTASAIGTITDFITNLDNIFDMTRILSDLQSAGKITLPVDNTPEGFLEDMQVLGAYAKAALHGIEATRTPGLNAVSADVKVALESWKALVPPDPSSTNIGDVVHRIAYNTQATQGQLRDVLLRVQTAIATVEALNESLVVDKYGALGTLRSMVDLINAQIDLSRNNGRLFDEHLLALAEMSIAENELMLALVERDNAKLRKTRLGCQLGRVTGAACAGVVLATTSYERIGALRDEACRAAQGIGDSVLLFDYFYQRSRDFVLLQERGTATDPSRDFRRNLLDPSQRTQFALGTRSSYQDDFLSALADVNVRDGSVRGDICWPGEACAGRGGEAYQSAVLSSLVARGRTEFEVDAECRPGEPDSRCNAALSIEAPKQRVANFDVRLVMAPGYRLGCTTPTGCPAASPADAPVLTGAQYVVDYQHGEQAEFLWTDGSYRTFLFTQAYPRLACEIVRAYTPNSTVDCRDLLFFGGTSDYVSALSEPLASYSRNDLDPALYGTSVRGQWSLDIGRTLAQLNGPAGDDCFLPDASNAARLNLVETCLPSTCASPCFTADGSRKAANDPSAPSYCSCYAASLALRPAGQLANRPECSGLPPTLTRVAYDAPALCGGGTGQSSLETLCKPYVSSQRTLLPSGDPACCTSSGHLKTGLSASQGQACNAKGFTSDDACTVPEPCLEICGPRCKAFKAALRGFSYNIHWRAR